MLKIEHIAIAVKDLKSSNLLFYKLLGSENFKEETVAEEKVKTSFFQIGDTKIELLASISEESPISKFIEKRGEGIHHIALKVSDLKAEIKRLKGEGFEFINEAPKLGADNKLICFIHPRSSNGVLVELCQDLD